MGRRPKMSTFQSIALGMIVLYAVLFFVLPKWYRPKLNIFVRFILLIVVSMTILSPLAWLVSGALKDREVMNEYMFLPPPSKWFSTDVPDSTKLDLMERFDLLESADTRVVDSLKGMLDTLACVPDRYIDSLELTIQGLSVAEGREKELFLEKVNLFRDVKMAFNKAEGDINFDNFVRLFEGRETSTGTVYFWRFIINTVFFATTLTMAQIFFNSLIGFCLAKYKFKGKKWIEAFILGTMMLPPILFMAPMYKLLHMFGWLDSYNALLIPAFLNGFGMFLFRQAIFAVPDDLLEAARIDGCNEFTIYWKIVMPLVKPMTATFTLITFLACWQNFIGPNVFLQSQSKQFLTVVIQSYVSQYANEYGVFLAGTLLALIPPAILFFLLNKEFVKGLTSGAVKG